MKYTLKLYLNIFRYHSQKFGVDWLRSWRGQIYIMQHAMYNTEYRQCHAARTLLEDFHKKSKHIEAEMSIRIVKIFDYAFSPLEAFLAESTATV